MAVPSVLAEPLTASYTWRSAVPGACTSSAKGAGRVPCVLGVDEAGRGPVLGPLVYGVAYCPADQQELLREVGFADSKALTPERRNALLAALLEHEGEMGWAVRVLSPQDISAGMLKRRPHNLNAQSSDATVHLIQGVLDAGVDITHIYVDTVGEPGAYARLLQSYFPRHPHIKWTVTRKADAIYPIVGAASIAAKVTRDAILESWQYAERGIGPGAEPAVPQPKRRRVEPSEDPEDEEGDAVDVWVTGSGYPGDPRTVRYLEQTLDPVFGWAGIVRFSWATAKTMLDEKLPRRGDADMPRAAPTGTLLPDARRAYPVRWMDEAVTLTDFFSRSAPRTKPKNGQRSMSTAAGAPARAPPARSTEQHRRDRDALQKHRPVLWRDLGVCPAGAADLLG